MCVCVCVVTFTDLLPYLDLVFFLEMRACIRPFDGGVWSVFVLFSAEELAVAPR